MSESSPSGSRLLVASLALAFLILLVVGNHYFFAFFQRSYLELWLEQGSLIVLTLMFVSLVWSDLDQQHPDLVSAHPGHYLRTCFVIVSGLFLAIANSLPAKGTQPRIGSQKPSFVRLIFDSIFGFILFFVVALTALAWLLIVAPAMYFLSLIVGAPARLAMLSGEPTAALVGSPVRTGQTVTCHSYALTFSNKPVTTTAAFTAVVLWFIKITAIGAWITQRIAY